ncbi:MAG: dihydrodipicolinate synthase family protein [Ectothiorhodospiraceae bacterium]|nr:dihydrodipicolinate synthase family protein [Ectothiorhodospiraceae bacterium]
MIPDHERPFDGVYAATLCPLRPDFSVDRAALADHVRSAVAPAGVVGVMCNGHAGENFTMDRARKRSVVETVVEAVGDHAIVVCGVNAEGSLEAADHARDAAAAGADAIMVFGPNGWLSPKRGDTVIRHHRIIVEAVDLPVMLFQASVNAGAMAYPPEVLRELAALPRVVGIKEGSWEVAAYEGTFRLLREVAPEMAVMGSGDEHLLTSLLIGSDGSVVSLAAVIPETIGALYLACKRADWAEARRLHETIYPLARAIYARPPGSLATARLKTCLALLGRFEHATMLPPIGPLPEEEIADLRATLESVGLRCVR